MRRPISLLAGLCLLATAVVPLSTEAADPGRVSGGQKYRLPTWFKQSFLEIAEDAAEAAEADRHAMLFMHLDECPYCAAVLEESLVESDYADWIRTRFDVIGINVRGAREVVFNAQLTATERELAEVLGVRHTPALVFLDARNQVVMRADGYRTAAETKRLLDYVDSKSYLTMDLPTFVRKHATGTPYRLRAHPRFTTRDDLSTVSGPLMVIFEDGNCYACALLHDTLLTHGDVDELLARFTVVRLDADTEHRVVTPAGVSTTPRRWTADLGLHARPAFLLFAEGKEQVRIEGVLRHFHFLTALRYVANEKYAEHATLREYSRASREALLNAGVDIDLGKQ